MNANEALKIFREGKEAKEQELMIGQMPRYVKGQAPPGVINKAPHIDSNYIDQQIKRGWQPLTPPGPKGPQLPDFVQNTGEDLMIAGNPYGYSDEYMHRSKALREIIDGKGYDPATVTQAQKEWIKLQQMGDIWKRVDAGGGDQNVASVNYGKEMPQNYRDWSEIHRKNYEEKAPGWLDKMKDHTKNYPTA